MEGRHLAGLTVRLGEGASPADYQRLPSLMHTGPESAARTPPHHDAIVWGDTMRCVDENQWQAFRRRAQMRTNRQMALILLPFGILIFVLKITEPMNYPAGDLRNEMTFRIAFYGLGIVVFMIGMVASIRWLIRDRQR
jgi:hypothetical protein